MLAERRVGEGAAAMQSSERLRFVSLWIALTLLLATILMFALFYQAAGA